MITLAQPKTWICRQCERPIDVWMPLGLRLDVDVDDDGWAGWSPPDPASLLCPEHRIESAQEQRRQFLWSLYNAGRGTKHDVGDPAGTLIFTRANLGGLNSPSAVFPSWLYSVAVDEWDEALPQPTTAIDTGDWSTVLVTLAAVVTVESSVGPGLYFRWSWKRPELDATCEIAGWNEPMNLPTAERLMAALGAFRGFQANRGRRRGSGRFSSREECEESMRRAMRVLRSKPRPEKVTEEAVGRYLAEQGPRESAASWLDEGGPADPGRQVRAWCTRFGLNFGELARDP